MSDGIMDTMVKVTTPSQLEQFVIGFEHDLTWGEIKKKTKARRKKPSTTL